MRNTGRRTNLKLSFIHHWRRECEVLKMRHVYPTLLTGEIFCGSYLRGRMQREQTSRFVDEINGRWRIVEVGQNIL